MAPSSKATDARRKSGGKPNRVVTLTVNPVKLRDMLKEGDSPSQDVEDVKQSPDSAATQPAPPVTTSAENASDSNAATPQAEGTPAPGPMGPPGDGPKKKGAKRSAAATNGIPDGVPKQRGKPGPKKKPRLEDGTIDHTTANKPGGGHKLGPKANLGAINAGLRALDRSGKPCRRWAKGGFRLKTFTGVMWEVPRWTAPPKPGAETGTEGSVAPSAESSSGKENKENGVGDNSAVNSNSGADAEMQSAPSVHASSPAPMAVTASA